ncbi:hypothetical protein CBR_g11099 [Chara braunii]|uniref:Reverse transcriptase domain-containing protein n=1 Tax=Chara braunii TaxID=69332 RepID=A0A388KQ45_CHABU|nr:hypothetical protein CBR_g11099 [Chara braunii]|eukprot:GBG72166.1 hypothetical protein CBR_g11099 [Chara braunii]
MRESALAGPCRINEGNEGELIIGESDFLLPQERTLMVELMKRRHRAYAFTDEERDRLDVDKIHMIRIHTVPHEPWNIRGARYPNPDEEKKVVDYLDGKIRTHVADYSSGPYASPWFCFIKPNGTLRWVQDLQRLNAVTVRDAGGLPNVDALSESCAGRLIISLIDFYSGYDQFPVYPPDRPVTAMHTPRGLIHMNVAPQGCTNAVAMVQRVMIRVMQSVSPHITQPYIDDSAVKGPAVKESDEVSPGVRRFVWKHIQDLDKVLSLLEEHNFTASGAKSRHCMREATILGSDFTKTAMPRGGKGTRPPQRPLGASGGYERHGLRHRESTPVYDDGDIELFLDSFWDHARHMGWTVAQAIERLRGAGRFEEPVARIRREATTRSEVEWRMQELRPSPVGPDGRLIRLEIGNASDFIPAFEWFMQGQGIPGDDWMQTLPLWIRKAERPLASQVRSMAQDWESCRAHLREAFRRPEPPQPRVERRQRSQRQRDPEPREARPSRGGRKALARREEEPEPEAEERGVYPECGLGPVEFHRFAEGELRRSAARTQEGPPTSEEPLRELEAHLDISQWRASPQGEERGEQAEEVPREEVPQEEVQDTQRERGLDDEGKRAGKEVIEVGEDTPPQTPVVGLRLGDAPGNTRQLPSPVRVGLRVGRKAEERLDRKIKFLAKATFDRHLLLESDLAGKKIKEAGHGVRLEVMEMEIQELRALVSSPAAIIESLRQRSPGEVDKPESNRQGEQSQPGHGLPGQPSAAETSQEPPMGRVVLEPEEARAQREAEREAFKFRAPTELATLPIAAAGLVIPLADEEGLPPSNSEPAQGSTEGSMDVLIEAVHSMQEEASLFSPERRIEEPLEREMRIEAEGVIEGGLQRLGTPEYGPEGIED